MKKSIMLSVLAIFLLFGRASAQTTSTVTVKGSELNNGVVLVTIVKEGKTYELSCNHGASGCVSLKSGKYELVELPENHGMYECRDVEVYAEPEPGQDPTNKIGEYCLTAK